MGRTIRRVPPGWEHPRDEAGRHVPTYGETYKEAAEKWVAGFDQWRAGTHPERSGYFADHEYYWEYAGDPPDAASHRPAFDAEPTCFQIYETVSEGTPVSPVFETREALAAWLVSEGHSPFAANRFASEGYAPSMVMDGRGIRVGIDSLDE